MSSDNTCATNSPAPESQQKLEEEDEVVSSIATNKASNESQEYPYPCHVNTASFLSIKLSGEANYAEWKEQILCLADSHDMLGFIDGTLKKPQENNGKYREWKRSDMLVKGWIFGSLCEDAMRSVIGLETANDVWNKLKTKYGTPADPVNTTTSTATCKQDFGHYIPLCRAIQMGDWEKALQFFIKDKDALTKQLNDSGDTTLHLAVGNPKNDMILDKLLELIDPELLPTLLNQNEHNALHYCTKLDNTIAAKKLVAKNPHLLFLVDSQGFLPIEIAACNSHRSTLVYLFQVCKEHIALSKHDDRYHDPFEGEFGVSLVGNTILAGFLDVAYDMLKDYPGLVTANVTKNKPLLWCISKKWDAYPSAMRYNFFQYFIYSYMPTENYELGHTYESQDIENQVKYTPNLVTAKSCINQVIRRIFIKYWKVALLYVPYIRQLHEEKAKHNIALAILKFICEEVSKLEFGHQYYYEDAFIAAVKNNTREVVEHLTQIFPQSIWGSDDKGYTISQLSIMNRCENIYMFLVHDVTQDKFLHNTRTDGDKNNLLHLARMLAPTEKLDKVTGAALQMQRELHWFKEVSQFMRPKEREKKNSKEETPYMVFRREHMELRKNGEQWIKKAADSYTITTTLIITIVFAAAITVPGGNNDNTGKAIYLTKPSFIIFFISDAISLFASTTSLLLFLSILTARYAEEDFLYKLPIRLILGLVMLFLSVTTMMVAFSATVYITFGEGRSWILIPIATLTCLPIASFVTLQLPVLVDLISSTYGSGIFGTRSDLRITS